MNRMPIIRLELESLKETVVHAVMARDEELQAAVKEELERYLTCDYLAGHIQREVKGMVDEAIKGMCTNWRVQEAVKEAIGDVVVAALNNEG